ncbi:MAG: vWA domain-containing protein [Paracoccaceae bacterium]
MTDDLDALKAALGRVPRPDPEARDAALALAMKNFDTLQGSKAPSRPIPEPTPKGFLNGARTMLKSLSSRPILATTTSIAAIAVAAVLVLPLTDAPPQREQSIPEAPLPPAPLNTELPAVEAASAEEATMQDAVVAPQTAPTAAPAQARLKQAPAGAAPLAESAQMDGLAAAAPASMDAEADFTLAQPTDPNTEAFATEDPNPVKITAEAPVSTFSIDTDTASYAVIRSSLNAGQLPDPAAVRVEEMVNYFPYAYPAPETEPFAASIATMPTPWNEGTQLVRIALQGQLPAITDRPALNLVFLIDTSGSMDEPNKLPLLKQSLRLMLGQLRPEDQVAIVAYAGSAGQVLAPTPASDSPAILKALDNLAAGGSTAGAEGLALAYQIAGTMAGDGEVSRILLATDGDFNVGVSDPEGLEAYVAKNRDKAYLSILGFGRGNLDDATMQALAQNGNGTAAYIDTLNEAQKVLVDQLTGALFPIANDVKIQVEWNPAQVAEYRLIGYETRALAREDFNNDRVDAGEIGAGHQVTALYEITPPGSAALRNDPLRYGTTRPTPDTLELGFLRLRYKAPGSDTSTLIETPITQTQATEDANFAAAIAGFGQLLQGSTYLGDWGWDDAIMLATANRGADPYGYRAEAISLMRLAESLNTP